MMPREVYWLPFVCRRHVAVWEGQVKPLNSKCEKFAFSITPPLVVAVQMKPINRTCRLNFFPETLGLELNLDVYVHIHAMGDARQTNNGSSHDVTLQTSRADHVLKPNQYSKGAAWGCI